MNDHDTYHAHNVTKRTPTQTPLPEKLRCQCEACCRHRATMKQPKSGKKAAAQQTGA